MLSCEFSEIFMKTFFLQKISKLLLLKTVQISVKKNGNKEESDSKNVLQNSNKANLKYISKRRLLGEVRKIKHFQKYHDLQAINLTVMQ